jgi:hypothetical protein
LVNLSVRHQVGRGSDAPLAGFALAGAGTRELLVRAKIAEYDRLHA